ncbi:unnamed protein product, partial [Musa acuminata var. zebrina]
LCCCKICEDRRLIEPYLLWFVHFFSFPLGGGEILVFLNREGVDVNPVVRD